MKAIINRSCRVRVLGPRQAVKFNVWLLLLCITIGFAGCGSSEDSNPAFKSATTVPNSPSTSKPESNIRTKNGYQLIPGANLTGAYLENADLRGVNLSGANLAGANLQRAYLGGANLSGANLTGANLRFAKLVSANLAGAILIAANLEGATVSSSNLAAADLSDANLTGANFTGSQLTGANLSGAIRKKTTGLP